ISGIVKQALTDYDVPTSADISVLVSVVGRGMVLAAFTSWDVPTSAAISAITSTTGYRGTLDALTNHDVPSSAGISAMIPNAVWNKRGTEPTTAPQWNSAPRGIAFDWLVARSLNRHSQTATKIEIYASAGSVIASASVGNNSTSATRDQFLG